MSQPACQERASSGIAGFADCTTHEALLRMLSYCRDEAAQYPQYRGVLYFLKLAVAELKECGCTEPTDEASTP